MNTIPGITKFLNEVFSVVTPKIIVTRTPNNNTDRTTKLWFLFSRTIRNPNAARMLNPNAGTNRIRLGILVDNKGILAE